MRERQGFREKIVNALAYPLFILSAAILGIVLLSIIIVPRIISIYEEIGLGLPIQLLERMSLFRGILAALGILVLTILASSLIVRWIRYQIEPLKVFWDRFLLRIPLAGKFLLYRDSLSFLFAMETLIGSGFTVEDGMKESVPTMENSAIRMNLQLIIKRIEKGTQLSQAFAEEHLFPQRIVQWIAVGERSGNVKAVFGQLRNYYQEEIKRWSTRVVAFAEPAFIVLVGIIVVSFLLVFILPIFTLYRDLL
jgi:general secretion pathway protein F